MTEASCLHCDGACRLTDGKEVYPHRGDLWSKPFWVCDPCGARVGCHPGTTDPLGHAANAETRRARSMLHDRMLDPIWKTADRLYQIDSRQERKKVLRVARRRTYAFLAEKMGLTTDETHTGMFTVEQCREAWAALKGQTAASIRAWAKARQDSTNANDP